MFFRTSQTYVENTILKICSRFCEIRCIDAKFAARIHSILQTEFLCNKKKQIQQRKKL